MNKCGCGCEGVGVGMGVSEDVQWGTKVVDKGTKKGIKKGMYSSWWESAIVPPKQGIVIEGNAHLLSGLVGHRHGPSRAAGSARLGLSSPHFTTHGYY